MTRLANQPDSRGVLPEAIDGKHLEAAVNEIVHDMRCGACAPTISQTVQILDLGEGKKAAVIVTITTAEDSFL
ncbi:MAG TPA: hypothetical protein VF798_03295 [Burkholderiaceae bacterium]